MQIKKLTKIALITISATFLFTGCKKEKNLESEYNNSQNLNPQSSGSSDSIKLGECSWWLDFENVEVFENTMNVLSDMTQTHEDSINVWLNSKGFNAFTNNNLRSSLGNGANADSTYNKITEVLAGLVSPEGVIQIDSMGFLLDYANGEIYEMYPVTCTNMNLLLNKEEILDDTNMYIYKYSMELDLFHYDYLDTPSTVHLKKGIGKFFKKVWNTITGGGSGGGIFCNDVHAHAIEYQQSDVYCYPFAPNPNKYYVGKLKTMYTPGGVWFETRIKFIHRWITETSWTEQAVKMKIKYDETHTVRCGGSGSDSKPYISYPSQPEWAWVSNVTYKPYRSSKALKDGGNSLSAQVQFKRSQCDTSMTEIITRPYFTW